MANPIALAAALSRVVKIRCPRCGHHKAVVKRPATFRVCPRCHRQFADPLTPRKRR